MANPWLDHLKAFKKKHPKLSLTECMQKAKATYKPKKKTQTGKGPILDMVKAKRPIGYVE